jgi:asparagine synthase (glutamine-hydrolysing)
MSRVSVTVGPSRANHDLLRRSENFERLGGSRLRKINGAGSGPTVTAYVSEGANPPVYCSQRADGSVAIVDGEIYDIDQSFAPGRAGNQSEWVLDAYQKSGMEIFERIDMAASLVLWDAVAEVLYVVRDRSGIVPSFYQEIAGAFFWASDLWTVMRLSGSSQFDHTAIDFFLANGFVPAPWSLIKGIEKLPPAHILSCTRNGSVGLKRYWPQVNRQEQNQTLAESTEAMTEGIRKALQRRWYPSGPNAAFLSGGLDSALVVAGLRELLDSEVDTFTIGYESYQGKSDERARARAAAQTLGTRHHEITFGPRDIADSYESMVIAHGAPFTWGLRAFFLRPIADAGFQAILGGDGPDAYYPSRTNLKANMLSFVPQPMRTAALSLFLPLFRAYAPDVANKISAVSWCADTGLPARCANRIIPLQLRSLLYRDRSFAHRAHQDAVEVMQAQAAEYSDWEALDRTIFLDLRYFDAENTLAFNHWWTIWHGLNYRLPFFDRDLLDIVFARSRWTPESMDIRQFARFFLPEDIARRPKLRTSVPIGLWLRDPLRDFVCDLLSPSEIGRLDILDGDGVGTLLAGHLKGQANHSMALWGLLTLVVWARLVRELSKDATPPTAMA